MSEKGHDVAYDLWPTTYLQTNDGTRTARRLSFRHESGSRRQIYSHGWRSTIATVVPVRGAGESGTIGQRGTRFGCSDFAGLC